MDVWLLFEAHTLRAETAALSKRAARLFMGLKDEKNSTDGNTKERKDRTAE